MHTTAGLGRRRHQHHTIHCRCMYAAIVSLSLRWPNKPTCPPAFQGLHAVINTSARARVCVRVCVDAYVRGTTAISTTDIPGA